MWFIRIKRLRPLSWSLLKSSLKFSFDRTYVLTFQRYRGIREWIRWKPAGMEGDEQGQRRKGRREDGRKGGIKLRSWEKFPSTIKRSWNKRRKLCLTNSRRFSLQLVYKSGGMCFPLVVEFTLPRFAKSFSKGIVGSAEFILFLSKGGRIPRERASNPTRKIKRTSIDASSVYIVE